MDQADIDEFRTFGGYFRSRHLGALALLFSQLQRICQKVGLVSLGHVSLNGTGVQANGVKHKDINHKRMLRAVKELEKRINALMGRFEILDT